MFKFGVDSFIWAEVFTEKDLWIIPKAKELGFETLDIAIAHPEKFPTQLVKEKARQVGIEIVTTTTLNPQTNPISPDPKIRENAVNALKLLVDINIELDSKILGGVNYAAWGYLTKQPRTEQEWEWSVNVMKQAAKYAKEKSDMIIAVECINRFETHFLNVAEDAVQYCKDVGTGNVKVHLDCFHMMMEEQSIKGAIETCGKEYLGYFHVNENNRGIPGTGLVPWKELFTAVKNVGYDGPLVIESFDPSFEELSGLCAIWRKLADSGEALAVEGLANLKRISQEVEQAAKPAHRIAIDCDDIAIDLKKVIYDYMKSNGADIVDLNYNGDNKGAAYPAVAFHLAQKIKNKEFDRGILICGTGLGMAMVANKVEGVYAGVCHDVYSAERLVKSNNAQVITMGSRVVGPELAKMLVDAWINSEFQGQGSLPKVEKIYELEKKSFQKEI